MNSLHDYVRNNFDGMLVFGDIHGDYESFKRAHDYAKSENFFFMSMGDLVDRGRTPFEVVKAMSEIVYDGLGGFVIGNHDDKFHRFANGAKVSFSRDAKQTLEDVGSDRHTDFMDSYVRLMTDKHFSALYHKFDDITLVHAASHPAIWEESPKIGKTERYRFIVGETNGETYDDGYPVRLYNWIEDIPMGKIVIVGHDRQPIHNVPITEPMIVSNKNGGKAIFLDTGCGKGGFLSGAVIIPDKKRKFEIVNFVDFK